ncbi:MAG: HEAT repeat domain-containing protein [Treponema sp.]|nr:HEAT repeat domain-containing protein [Treponema sp.]
MHTIRRFFIFVIMAVFTASFAAAQSNSGRELSVEESYLQEAIENMIIREMSRADNLDQKLVALEYIGEAIKHGNTSDDVLQALEYLSMEGQRTIARENGRIMNNFPSVRRQTAKYLGQIGTQEASDALVMMLHTDNESMVLQEVIKSLGEIGINNNNETVIYIIDVTSRYDRNKPDNILAVASIEALEKIAKKSGSVDPNAINLLMRISQGAYIKPVQERAKQAIANMRSYGNK